MKKYIIFIFLLFVNIITYALSTLQVQGIVSNVSNGSGISNCKVYVTDNLFYNDSILTGSNGNYYLIISNVNATQNFVISVKDCNNMMHSATANATNPLNTINFVICYTVPMNCQNGFSYIKQSNTQFNFTGSNASTYPTLYYWNFGDGQTATGQNVSHTYAQPAVSPAYFQVTLNTKTFFPNDSCFYQSIQTIMITDTNPKIRGKVTANDTVVANSWVILFGINNPIGSCTRIDTAYVDNQGYYQFSNFPVNYPAYILKADFPYFSNTANYYIPTYYDTLYSWLNSPPVFPVTDTTTYNLQLINFVPNQVSGIAYISGAMHLNGDKSNKSLLKNIDIFLINQNNQVLKLNKPDLIGNYSFYDLPFGTYKVFVELPGKICTPGVVTLSSSNPFVTNFNFEIRDNAIILATDNEIQFENLIGSIYPNPANDLINIDFSLKKYTEIKLSIFNHLGQIVIEQNKVLGIGSQHIQMDIKDLKPGYYTLKISDGKQMVSKKLIKI